MQDLAGFFRSRPLVLVLRQLQLHLSKPERKHAQSVLFLEYLNLG
jgi:hypothetical protein